MEDDLTILQEFPHLHQRLKLATFCINTRPTYLMLSAEAAEPSISRPFLKQLDSSVDHVWQKP